MAQFIPRDRRAMPESAVAGASHVRHFVMHVRRASHGAAPPLNCGVMRQQSDPAAALRAQIRPDESLLWADRPLQGVKLRRLDLLLIPLSVLWSAFAFWWEYTVIREGAWFFAILGAVMVAGGVYLLVGRFLVESYRRSRAWYGLTDRRVIILCGERVRALDLRSISEMSLSESKTGTGAISFGRPDELPWWYGNWWPPGWERPVGEQIELIREPRRVFEQITAARRAAA
jgi:hypothetical protein